jgi:hypothetical protein
MTTLAGCPDFSLLSQFCDYQLGEETEEQLRQHLEVCVKCRTTVEHLGQVEGVVRTALTRSSSRFFPQVRAQECLSPETVSAYVQRALSAEEGGIVEKHLQTCNACLSDVMEAFRISALLTATKKEPVPTTLKERVASLWKSPPVQEKTRSFSRVVIQITQKGLKLLEPQLVPPLLDVQEIFAPAPVYRSGEGPATLHFKISAGQTEIRVTAIQEGEGIALTMTFVGARQEALAGQRVFLRQHGRSLFSAKTDSDGMLRVPRLEPGVYEVACPGMNATFQLELRSFESQT